MPIVTYPIEQARRGEILVQYASNIRLADSYVRDGNTDRASEILFDCPPQLRNWEWGRLMFECHRSFLTIDAHVSELPQVSRTGRPHTGRIRKEIRTLSFSPDGTRLFSHGEDDRYVCTGGDLGTARVWETATGRNICIHRRARGRDK